MKNIFMLVLVSVLSCNIASAESNFENYEWWKTATVEDVQKELDNGADVNAIDGSKRTALMNAVACRSPEIVKLLLDAGADMNAKDKLGRTGLMYAVHICMKNNIKVCSNKSAIIKTLIDAGADVNAKDKFGQTAFLMASHHESPEVIKIFLDNGVSKEEKNTILRLAAYSNTPEVVKLLIDAGADVNAKDENGYTAWGRAEDADKDDIPNRAEVKRILEEAGAKTTIQKIKVTVKRNITQPIKRIFSE